MFLISDLAYIVWERGNPGENRAVKASVELDQGFLETKSMHTAHTDMEYRYSLL